MELQKIQVVANKIADDMINGIRKNLQEFDKEISMLDVAVALLMASIVVLDTMYQCTMVRALGAMQEAVKTIRIKKEEN